MDYNIKLADLILVKGVKNISEIIEYITGSSYSHCAGVVKDNELIEANGFRKIGYQALDYYSGFADIYTCDFLTDEQRNQIVEYVEKQIGKHYNWFLFILEFLRYVFHLVIPYKDNHTSEICSTLWADAYKNVGIDLCNCIYPSPADLANSKLLHKVNSL